MLLKHKLTRALLAFLALTSVLSLHLFSVSINANAASGATVSTVGIENYDRLFSKPTDIALLKDGSLLVIDEAQYAIKKVVGERVTNWTTFESRFPSYLTGDEPCALEVNKSDEVYVVNCSQTKLFKFSIDGRLLKTVNIPLLGVKDRGFDWGGGMALDSSNNVYLSDEKNIVVLKVNPETGAAENYAGTPGVSGSELGPKEQIPLRLPRGLAFDKFGALYIADAWAGRIRTVDPNGSASYLPRPPLCHPNHLAFDTTGNLYVLTEYFCGPKIVKMDLGLNGNPTNIIDETFTGISSVPFAMTGRPKIGLSSNAGAVILPAQAGQESLLVVADGKNGNLKYFDLRGNLKKVLGSQDTYGVVDTQEQNPIYNEPHSVFPLDDGSLLVLDLGTARLVNPSGKIERYLHLPWECGGGSTVSSSGDIFCVWGNKINIRFADGSARTIGNNDPGFADGRDTQAKFSAVSASRNSNDDILIADGGNHSIRLLERDQNRNSYNVSTLVKTTISARPDYSQPKSATAFSWPSKAVLAPDNRIFVAEGGWDRLRIIDPGSSGLVHTTAGNFRSWPSGMAIDGAGNTFVLTERGFLYNLKSNALSRIGGNGPGVNDGPLTEALFYSPKGLAVDRDGNLLVADSFNNLVRKIEGLNLSPNYLYNRASLSRLLNSMTVVIKSSNTIIGPANDKPATPRFSGVNFVGNKINISVNIGSTASSRPDKIYLVAPKLGFTATNPLAGVIAGSNATWTVDLSEALAGTMLPLEVVGEKNGVKSESASASYRAPNLISKASKVPVAPKKFKQRIVGSSAVVTVESTLRSGALASDAYLFSKSLGVSKGNAIQGEILGTKVLFEISIRANMAGKKFPVTIYFANELGDSKPLEATLVIPSPPKSPSVPNVAIKPPTTQETVICVFGNQTRAFAGKSCPPGWSQN